MTTRDTTLERELPDELADQFAAVGLGRAPGTLGEWAELTVELLESADVPTGLDAMCTTDRDRHEATVGGEARHLHCVLDALLVPFVADVDEPVAVRSRSPRSGEVIEIEVSREGVDVTPEEAVISFGIAADAGDRGGDAIEPDDAYELFCPYVNAFTSREEYDRWAEATGAAITVGLTVDEGYELARSLEGGPGDPDDSHNSGGGQ